MGQAEFFAKDINDSKDINDKYCNQSQIGCSVVANFLAL